MYEYKTEVLDMRKESKGLKVIKTILDHIDTSKLDDFLNAQAAGGWELVCHSTAVDAVIGRVNAVVTLRRAK